MSDAELKALEESVEIVLDLTRGPVVLWALASDRIVFGWTPDVWWREKTFPYPRYYLVEARAGPPEMWAIALQVLFMLQLTVHEALQRRRDSTEGRRSFLRACAARELPEDQPKAKARPKQRPRSAPPPVPDEQEERHPGNEGDDDADEELRELEAELHREEQSLAAEEAALGRERRRRHEEYNFGKRVVLWVVCKKQRSLAVTSAGGRDFVVVFVS